MQSRHDKQVRELTKKLEEASERLLEVSGDLESLETKYNLERKQWDTSQVSLRSSVNQSLQQHSELQRHLDEARASARHADDRVSTAIKDAEERSKA